MSAIHPGSSIVFDAANLQNNDDEKEMLQEELRKRQELRELLSAELSDDLLDDDHSSVNDSRQSSLHNASHEQMKQAPANAPPDEAWNQDNHELASSTGQQPPTAYYGAAPNGHDYPPMQHTYNHNFNNHQQQYYDPSYGHVTSQAQHWPNHGNGNIYAVNSNGMMQPHLHPREPMNHGHAIQQEGDEFTYRPTDQRQVEGREDFGEMVDGNRTRPQQHFIQFNHHNKNVEVVSTTSESLLSPHSSKASYRQSYPPQKVHYGGIENRLKTDRTNHHDPLNLTIDDHPSKQENGTRMNLHDEINQACGDPRLDTSGRQMTQLQILYKARGKRIDELTRELDDIKVDSARQSRMLNHQLAIAKDERAGMGTSLEKSQQLVSDKDREMCDLKGKLDAQSAELDALKSAKEELVSKIQVLERTIESLHEQLTQLSNMDTMERAREQHNAVLSATNQRHEMQVLELTTQLDECRQQLEDKNEEFSIVKAELNTVSRGAEQTMLEKTETINRLTKSLEEAQKQCQGLLAGSNENALAKHQVNDLLAERKSNEEEIAYLRMQVSDFEEHLKLYENALQLGAGGFRLRHARSGSMSDSIGDLMGGQDLARKLDWKTPPPKKTKDLVGGEDELIDGLRQELQRALKCNKAKRDEITKLKAECSELEQESSHWRSRADEVQTQLKMNAPVVNFKSNDAEIEENFLRIRDLEEQLKTANEEIERLEGSCADVKQRMADMIHEHDQDKQRSIERCERALMQLHDDAKQALRDEIVSEYEQKMYELSVDCDAKMREISAEMEQIQQELYDVKQSYVHVCAEKDSIQSTVMEELTMDFEKEKEAIVSEHQGAIEKLQKMLEDLEKDMVAKIQEQKENHSFELNEQIEKITNQLREEWEKENESEFSQELGTQIALAKVKWFEDFAESKQVAIQEAVKVEEGKWTDSLHNMKQAWENDKKSEIEKSLKGLRLKMEEEKAEEIDKIREEFQNDKDSAMKTVQCMAELNKNLQYEDHQLEIERKLKEAREIWQKESNDALKNAEEIWKAEQACELNAAIEESRKLSQKELEIELEKQNSIMEKAVLEMKKVCDAEKHNALKQKCLEMEKEIKKLQDQHKIDYEKFVDDHRKTLASFLEREKSRSRPNMVSKDASSQVEESENLATEKWMAEKRELENQKNNEISKMQRQFDDRFSALRKEIQDLTLEKHHISMKLERSESQNQITMETATLERVKETSRLEMENHRLKSECESINERMEGMKEKHKADTEKLKVKIRDEYKKWKTERSLLIDKLKQLPSNQQSSETLTPIATQEVANCKFCKETKDRLLQTKDEAMRKAVAEMSNIYAETLRMIKDEMTTYITEVRARTKETISRDRKHTAARIQLHYTKVTAKRSKENIKQIPQSFQRLKMYESDSDTGSLGPGKYDGPVADEFVPHDELPATPTTSHSTDKLFSSERRPKDSILDRFLIENEFHQYPTKLVSSPAKLPEEKPPRKVEFRDNQLYSTSSMQRVVPNYQTTTPNMNFDNYRPAHTKFSTEQSLFNPDRDSNYGRGVYSPARSRSEEYVSNVIGYQRVRTNSPSYRGVTRKDDYLNDR